MKKYKDMQNQILSMMFGMNIIFNRKNQITIEIVFCFFYI